MTLAGCTATLSGEPGEGPGCTSLGCFDTGPDAGPPQELVCGTQAIPIEPLPPNVLIVLDRSGSMQDNGKWGAAQSAVGSLVQSYGQSINFGLTLFPNNNSCGDGKVSVDVGSPTAGQDIINTMLSVGPGGDTPLGDTLNDMLAYPGLMDTSRHNYVLLVSDGAETCGGHPGKKVDAFRARTPEVKTFVVGFGSGVDSGTLNDLAVRGGTAKAVGTKYYQANSGFELTTALQEIADQASITCNFVTDAFDQSLGLNVFFDGVEVPDDAWSYDPTTSTLAFHGSACDQIRDVNEVRVEQGCPSQIE